eukprot:4916866-Amphidinium_carterae.1
MGIDDRMSITRPRTRFTMRAAVLLDSRAQCTEGDDVLRPGEDFNTNDKPNGCHLFACLCGLGESLVNDKMQWSLLQPTATPES